MNQVCPDKQGIIKDVIINRSEAVGQITLNSPSTLNALSLEMIRQIAGTLHQWKDDPNLQCVVFQASPGRAFCAGGDIKSFYYAGMDYRRNLVSARVPALFFAEEYSLNKQIAHYPKTTIAIMDGIVMGGGYGIAGHCRHRIVSENTLFAMPEVGIGFFPDVGSLVHLLKTPHHFGAFLALTGERVGAGDMLAAGLADACIESQHHESFLQAIEKEPDTAIEDLIDRFTAKESPERVFMEENTATAIESVFSSNDIHDILEHLGKIEQTRWVRKALRAFFHASPVSVFITAEHLRRCKGLDVDAVLAEDFILAQNFIAGADFYEGIRAALIDKDKAPQWTYNSYKNCPPELIQPYFKPTGYELSEVRIFET